MCITAFETLYHIILRSFSLTPFLFALFLCSFSFPGSAASAYQTRYYLDTNPHHFIIIPPHHTPIHLPLKIALERSELPVSRTSKPKTRDFDAYCNPSCPNHSWTAQIIIWNGIIPCPPNTSSFGWSPIRLSPHYQKIGLCSSPFRACHHPVQFPRRLYDICDKILYRE